MNSIPISELVEKIEKLDPRTEFGGGQFTYVDIGSVSQTTKSIEDPQTISCDEAPSRARQVVASGDVLVSTVRPNLNAVAQVPNEFDGTIASTGFSVLRPNTKVLNSSYLYHWVKTEEFVNKMMLMATGQSYPAVSDRIVRSSKIPLPPLSEQKRIAGILDQADALVRLRRRALEKLNTLGQAIFHEMFGDPAANSMKWPRVKIRDSVEKISDGPFGSNLKSSHYTEEGIRVWRLQNIGVGEVKNDDQAFVSEEHFSTLTKHECLPGDVIVGTLGEPNLRACIQPENIDVALNKADCVQIRPDNSKALAEFWLGVLNHPSTIKLAHSAVLGQTRARISMGRLREIELPMPPLDRQEAFKLRMKQIEAIKVGFEWNEKEGTALFASLQHRAFRGEL